MKTFGSILFVFGVAMLALFGVCLAYANEPTPLYTAPVALDDSGQMLFAKKASSQENTTTPNTIAKVKNASSRAVVAASDDDEGAATGSQKKSKSLWAYKKSHFNMYSVKDEVAIGETYIKKQSRAFEKKGLTVNPPKYEKTRSRINSIVQRLAKVSDMPNLPYEVTIFEKDDVANAFCLPGGKIGVFTGIFTKANTKGEGMIDETSDSEIAAVISHEMAHAALRHVTRSMTTYSAVGIVGGLVSLGVAQGAGESWARLADQVISTGSSLYMPSYSRKHEREADQVGFYYLAKAGFDVNAAINIWEKASQMASKKGKKETSFFASHPASGERAANLRSWLNDALLVQQQQKKQGELYKKMTQ